MEGRRESASAAEMTFRDEGMQPGRHPRMTLIKGRFYQSLLAGAGSRDLKKNTYLSRWERRRRILRSSFRLAPLQASDAESSRR